jgi:hypothetical protein
MRAVILTAAALLSAAGLAKAEEKPVPGAELQRVVVGKSVNIGSASAHYGKDGRYSFNGGNFGKYKIQNGRICVDFDAGASRCDKIVKDAGNYYLIDGRGVRFRFRP